MSGLGSKVIRVLKDLIKVRNPDKLINDVINDSFTATDKWGLNYVVRDLGKYREVESLATIFTGEYARLIPYFAYHDPSIGGLALLLTEVKRDHWGIRLPLNFKKDKTLLDLLLKYLDGKGFVYNDFGPDFVTFGACLVLDKK